MYAVQHERRRMHDTFIIVLPMYRELYVRSTVEESTAAAVAESSPQAYAKMSLQHYGPKLQSRMTESYFLLTAAKKFSATCMMSRAFHLKRTHG